MITLMELANFHGLSRGPQAIAASEPQLICPTGNPHMAGMRKLPGVLLCRSISVLSKLPPQRHIPGHPAST